MATRKGFNVPKLDTANIPSTSTISSMEIPLPYLTIPPGLSPTAFFESPALFSNISIHSGRCFVPVSSRQSFLINISSRSSLCNCLLPEAHKITAVQHDPDSQSEDGEKQRLRSAFSCLFSISMRQRQFCTSSLLLTSPSRGCLSLPELRSGTIALKDYRKLLELVYDEQFDSF
ncbi:hypothetical protein ZIOFF_032043 [Zingiber officinale]|uniref:Uncharacterized protein n=1 Tax=Zingiber officinale TaxID=94328 RepID=A0A8J5GIH3_ZINOF|nr:hypothetical protein ZIOFF_032043 [Zingiber officinale]